MPRKAYVEMTTRLIIDLDDGVEVDDVISEMDYKFTSTTNGAVIVDTEIREHEVMDCK